MYGLVDGESGMEVEVLAWALNPSNAREATEIRNGCSRRLLA